MKGKNATLYIQDQDIAVFEAARQMANALDVPFSRLIVKLLRDWGASPEVKKQLEGRYEVLIKELGKP